MLQLNILVSSSHRAIITDFGSARAIIESEDDVTGKERNQQMQETPTTEGPSKIHVGAIANQLTLTGPAWSLRWAPPEVVNGKRPSLSSDVWAAGWVCWEVGGHTSLQAFFCDRLHYPFRWAFG